MFVMTRALATRARLRHVYEQGDYVPIQAAGERRSCLFAFARLAAGPVPSRQGSDPTMAITCVPRFVASLTPGAAAPPIGRCAWTDTRIELPPEWAGPKTFREVFTGATLDAEDTGGGHTIPAASLFEQFPVALLVSCST